MRGKTGIAILGVGRWGIHWVRNFLHHPQAELIAIVDPSPERLAECREKFLPDRDGVILATDWDAACQREGIEAAVIATPAATHYPLVASALHRGYHVLVEKPLTLDPAQCLELTRLAEKKQRQLFVDHTYLFHPAVERGRQVLEAGKLGELRYGYASRTHLGPVRRDVDALWDLAIHDIAIFNAWLGQVPIQVSAQGTVWLQPDSRLGQGEAAAEKAPPEGSPGLSDLVWATLRYPDGFEAHLHLCWLNPDKQRRLCLVGTQGSLIFDEMRPEAPLTLQHGYFQRAGEAFVPAGQSREIVSVEAAEPLKRACDRFLTSLQSGRPCAAASGWLASQLVQILTCLSLSLQRQGEVVTVPPVKSG